MKTIGRARGEGLGKEVEDEAEGYDVVVEVKKRGAARTLRLEDELAAAVMTSLSPLDVTAADRIVELSETG